MRTCGKNEQGELAALWAQVLPRVGEVEHKVGNACRLVREPSDDGFEYVAGLDVCCVKDLPEGMVGRTVAELRYAVFT
jgi:predicted transcriptional regulator YdeE